MKEVSPKIIMSQESFETEYERLNILISGLYFYIEKTGKGDDSRKEILDDERAAFNVMFARGVISKEEILKKLNTILFQMKQLPLGEGIDPKDISDENLELDFISSDLEREAVENKKPPLSNN